MSKVQHENQTPPSVEPLLDTPEKRRREGGRKPRPHKKRQNNGFKKRKKHGTNDQAKLEARMIRDAATCDCGKLKQNPKNNACVECWLRKKPETPPKKKRKQHEQTLTGQTLTETKKAILIMLQDPTIAGRYDLVYKPTHMRSIKQYYNRIAEKERIIQEQREKEVMLLEELHKAQQRAGDAVLMEAITTPKANGVRSLNDESLYILTKAVNAGLIKLTHVPRLVSLFHEFFYGCQAPSEIIPATATVSNANIEKWAVESSVCYDRIAAAANRGATISLSIDGTQSSRKGREALKVLVTVTEKGQKSWTTEIGTISTLDSPGKDAAVEIDGRAVLELLVQVFGEGMTWETRLSSCQRVKLRGLCTDACSKALVTCKWIGEHFGDGSSFLAPCHLHIHSNALCEGIFRTFGERTGGSSCDSDHVVDVGFNVWHVGHQFALTLKPILHGLKVKWQIQDKPVTSRWGTVTSTCAALTGEWREDLVHVLEHITRWDGDLVFENAQRLLKRVRDDPEVLLDLAIVADYGLNIHDPQMHWSRQQPKDGLSQPFQKFLRTADDDPGLVQKMLEAQTECVEVVASMMSLIRTVEAAPQGVCGRQDWHAILSATDAWTVFSLKCSRSQAQLQTFMNKLSRWAIRQKLIRVLTFYIAALDVFYREQALGRLLQMPHAASLLAESDKPAGHAFAAALLVHFHQQPGAEQCIIPPTEPVRLNAAAASDEQPITIFPVHKNTHAITIFGCNTQSVAYFLRCLKLDEHNTNTWCKRMGLNEPAAVEELIQIANGGVTYAAFSSFTVAVVVEEYFRGLWANQNKIEGLFSGMKMVQSKKHTEYSLAAACWEYVNNQLDVMAETNGKDARKNKTKEATRDQPKQLKTARSAAQAQAIAARMVRQARNAAALKRRVGDAFLPPCVGDLNQQHQSKRQRNSGKKFKQPEGRYQGDTKQLKPLGKSDEAGRGNKNSWTYHKRECAICGLYKKKSPNTKVEKPRCCAGRNCGKCIHSSCWETKSGSPLPPRVNGECIFWSCADMDPGHLPWHSVCQSLRANPAIGAVEDQEGHDDLLSGSERDAQAVTSPSSGDPLRVASTSSMSQVSTWVGQWSTALHGWLSSTTS